MSFDVLHLAAVVLAFCGLLTAVAVAVETGTISKRWVASPLVYVLSLGVYAGGWAFYGSVGLAYDFGYGFLAFYLGVCGAFLLAPVLMTPLLRITKTYQLSSLADLFTFRYRSQLAGTLVALFSLLGTAALLAVEMRVVASSTEVLNDSLPGSVSVALFAGLITLFSVLHGARRVSLRRKNETLIMVVASEALIKVSVLLLVAAIALWQIFDGPTDFNQWLEVNGSRISPAERSLEDAPWRALLLIFFAAALVSPHMFHMTFTENLNNRNLYRASWGFPLLLLLLSLPVPIVLWSGIKLGLPIDPQFFVLAVSEAAGQSWLTLLLWGSGVAAAATISIVMVVATSSMLLNHILLPIAQPTKRTDIYTWLLWAKRLLILCVILFGVGIYALLGHAVSLSVLGVLAFSSLLQFLPGVLATLYWPLGNRQGLVAGLVAGQAAWAWLLLLPLGFSIDLLEPLPYFTSYTLQAEDWHWYATVALSLNVACFVVVSLFTPMSPAEQNAAQSCSVDALSSTHRRELELQSSDEFKHALEGALGSSTADKEVSRALRELQLGEVEFRPYALRRLRDRIEANLSGLLGPALAEDIVARHLRYKQSDKSTPNRDVYFVERRLEDYRSRLTGLAAELDGLRRYHRQTLQQLPVGACSLGADMEIQMWNGVLADLTDISEDQVVGNRIDRIDEPWRSLLYQFAVQPDLHLYKKRIEVEGGQRWLSLHKAYISGGQDGTPQGQVILLEDLTDTQLLEEELIHSQRLASVGRLAAGVAHEIGNPITGIACLAQNLRDESEDAETLELSNQILQLTQRVDRIMQSLMNFSRSGNFATQRSHELADLTLCMQEAVHLVSLSAKGKQIQFELACDGPLHVLGDEQRLMQVFVNLLSNARDASTEGSTVWLRGRREDYNVVVEVEDQGQGIPAEQLDQIFDPFFTTKDPDQGTGLGLSLVYTIVEEHYGHIHVDSRAHPNTPNGTLITLTLPATQPVTATEAS